MCHTRNDIEGLRVPVASGNTQKFLAASLPVLPFPPIRRMRPRFRSLNEVTPTWRVRGCQRDGPFVARKRGASRSRCTFCSSIFIKSGLPVRKLRATSSATRMLLFSRLQFITELYPCKDVTGYNRGSMTNCTRGRMSHSPCSLIP